MALPARTYEPQKRAPVREERPVKLVEVKGRAKQKRQQNPASMKKVFWTVATCFVLLAAFGLGRVYLSSLALGATVESSKLTAQIQSTQARGDDLELEQSKLSRPDRIKTIASTSLKMGPAQKTTYVDLAPEQAKTVAQVNDTAFESSPSKKSADAGFVGFVRTIFAPSEAGAGVVRDR